MKMGPINPSTIITVIHVLSVRDVVLFFMQNAYFVSANCHTYGCVITDGTNIIQANRLRTCNICV